MTSKSIADLNSQANTTLADNSTGDVSAEDARNMAKDLADSALNREDDLGFVEVNFPIGSHFADDTNPPDELTLDDNKYVYRGFDGAGTTKEITYFSFKLPKGADTSSAANLALQFKVEWTSAATDTDSAVYGVRVKSIRNGDAYSTAFGTAQEVTDAHDGSTENQNMTDWSSTITPGGTLASEAVMLCEFYRDPANGSDNMAEDGRVIDVIVRFKLAELKDD